SVETQNAPIINEVKSDEIQIQLKEDQLKKRRITNPIKGTVLVKYAEPHEITAIGRPLYKIADLEQMTIRVYISENQLANLKIGQEVAVKIDAGEQMKQYPGKVTCDTETAELTAKIIQTN